MQLVLAALLLALDVAASWLPTAPALRPRHDTRAHRAASATRRAASITAAAGGGARLVYCDGLSKSYDGQRFQFRDISLGVATGQRVGLIGVNGVGKSTLMKCLAGIEQHDAGRSALSLCLCPGLRLSLRLSPRLCLGSSLRLCLFPCPCLCLCLCLCLCPYLCPYLCPCLCLCLCLRHSLCDYTIACVDYLYL